MLAMLVIFMQRKVWPSRLYSAGALGAGLHPMVSHPPQTGEACSLPTYHYS